MGADARVDVVGPRVAAGTTVSQPTQTTTQGAWMGTATLQRRRLVLLAVAATTALLTVGVAAGVLAAERFSDVADDHAFSDQIAWMADAGISEGYADGTFRPDDPVTRQAMAAFMERLAGADPEVGQVVDAASLQGVELAAITDRLDALEAENDELRGLLEGVERLEVDGRDTLRFEAMNVQVVDGSGDTDGDPNGSGNLIVGYDGFASGGSDKSGSHNLVVGERHSYTSFGGIVAGLSNTASAPYASVTGGADNTASGNYATVTGGSENTASGVYTSVSGGGENVASGQVASVTGGRENTASHGGTTVSGGQRNSAANAYGAVFGGYDNAVTNFGASVLGGQDNTAGGYVSSILGGDGITTSDNFEIQPTE